MINQVITSDLVKNSPDVKQHYKEILSATSRDMSGKRRNFKGGKGLGKERLGMINGRVYIIGGLADTKVPSDVEVFIPHHTKLSRDPNTFVRNTFTPAVDDVTKTHSDDVKVMTSQLPVVTVECGGRNVTRSYGGGATVVDGAVYLVGGRSDSGVSDKLYQLELHSQRYKEVGKVPVWCDHVTVTSSDKKVFVIGGYQLSDTGSLTPSSLVQIYDTASQEWTTGPELTVPRAHATSIGIDSGGGLASRVLVLGGYGTNKLSSVELITDGVSVENMPPMLKPRHAFCAAMVEGTIIALGGWNERTVEKYDFRNKQWSLLKDFPKQRDCIQGEVCEGVLYVFGGVKKNKNVSTIEKYDYERDSWRTVGQFMVPRLYSAVVVT
ncbi:kelch-like protein 17 [Bolinopsis microptera]|uniref:kelch-like protein 17 n=2 Tax=Bolinopsis microptera TaxID=2820187 RepID=UPI00307999CA